MVWLNFTMPNQTVKWPKGLKYQNAPNKFFSQKTTNNIFMCLLAPSILQNFLKILVLIQSYEHLRHFRAQNGLFVLNKIFLVHTEEPELRLCTTFRPKMVHLPQTNFFWKTITIILI